VFIQINTIILAVTPQCLNTVIWEEIHMHLGHQARIPLNKEEKLDLFPPPSLFFEWQANELRIQLQK